jgi:hypothetical protein
MGAGLEADRVETLKWAELRSYVDLTFSHNHSQACCLQQQSLAGDQTDGYDGVPGIELRVVVHYLQILQSFYHNQQE